MQVPDLVFHRPALAATLSGKILNVAIGSAAGSGIFLAAPRRTGKSTFAREDLRPALEAAGALTLYVDLWENTTVDPGVVIVSAIRTELAKHEGVIRRLAKSVGLSGLTVGGVAFDLHRVGLGNDISLSKALSELSDETGKVIVLMIDEAQQTMATEQGTAVLYALKAARDELNSSAHHGLRLICTGSNSDKLAMLRNGKDQPFFGAPLIKFPHLGQDYIDWFCANADLGFSLDSADVMALFRKASYRPEVISAAADTFRFDLDCSLENGSERFADEVAKQIEAINQEMIKVVHSLTPIQSAILRVMAASGTTFAPFEAATLEKYKVAMMGAGISAPKARAEIPAVQQALSALQDKKLVWKAARGVYAIEESNLVDLLFKTDMLDGLK
jgi:hypothetical protein